MKKLIRIGAVILLLALTVIPTIPISATSNTTITVAASEDDIDVYWDGGAWAARALNYATGNIGHTGVAETKQGVGLRFINITIPQGATIVTAYLKVKAWNSFSNVTVNSVIIGYDTNDAGAFSNLADYQGKRGTIVGGANDTNLTTASATWAVTAWSAGVVYNSPEIKTIVQEIVNRAGWASGNDIALFWDDHAGNSTVADNTHRLAWAWDASSGTGAPQLYIEYATPSAVTTSAASGVAMTGATLNGSLSSLGTATSAAVSFEYGLTASYGSTATVIASPLSAPGAFSANITGLEADTIYHFRAKVVSDGLTVYGSDRTLNTTAPLGTVILQNVIPFVLALSVTLVSFKFIPGNIASYLAAIFGGILTFILAQSILGIL